MLRWELTDIRSNSSLETARGITQSLFKQRRRWEVLDGGRSCGEDKASLGTYLYVNVCVCICETEEESVLKN